MSKLITASLIGSVEWLQNCPSSWKEKAYNDLFNQLSRIWPKETPHYIQRGFDLENKVQQIVESGTVETIKSSEHFSKLLNHCVGGKFQKTTKSFMTINNEEYCLYGKIDVWFPETIKDIKNTQSYKESSYKKSAQHMIYCHNEQIKDFVYLVADFNDKDKEVKNKAIQELYEVPIHIDDFEVLENELRDRIKKTIDFIYADEDLAKLYETKFNRFG